MDVLVGMIAVAAIVGVIIFVASLLGRKEETPTVTEAVGTGLAGSLGCMLQMIPIVFIAMVILLIGSCLWT